MHSSSLTFSPIPASYLEELRGRGVDEAGNLLQPRVDGTGGSPLRCCLRDSLPGETVLLIAYTPPGGAGAYAERGPVFVHGEPCAGYATPHDYPRDLRDRSQVVRAYDNAGRIADAAVVANAEQGEAAIRELISRPDVALVQLRNVGYGCYSCAVHGIA